MISKWNVVNDMKKNGNESQERSSYLPVFLIQYNGIINESNDIDIILLLMVKYDWYERKNK